MKNARLEIPIGNQTETHAMATRSGHITRLAVIERQLAARKVFI
jgi:hypothetical protein